MLIITERQQIDVWSDQMNKIIMWLAIFCLLIVNVPSVSAKSGKAELINQLMELPTSSYDKQEADNMITRIGQISPDILERLVQNKVKIRLINGKLTDEPEYRELRGVTPRGWEGTGETWDDVPGIGGNPVILRIGYSETGQGHGSLNLELHETSHAIDMYVLGNVSQSEKFIDVFNKEANQLFPKNGYMDTFVEEYFAESSCMYFFSNQTRNQIKTLAPLTYSFLTDIYASADSKKPATFKDLPDTHWAHDAIYKAVNEGYVNGYDDGTFGPDKEITRAEFVKMLTTSFGLQPRAQKDHEAWYVPYLELGSEEFIVTDENLSRTNWSAPLTRLEMAQLCLQSLHLGDTANPMQTAVKEGIIQGTSTGMEPDRTSTRAQSVAIIERTLSLHIGKFSNTSPAQ
jgi:hypothetical protein